jgi:hypothetical protein
MNSRNITTFARSVVGGAILFGSLFTPETDEGRRRRMARARLFPESPEFWRGWPGLSTPSYRTDEVPGGCPLWLAVFLGSAAGAFTIIVVAHEAWRVFR